MYTDVCKNGDRCLNSSTDQVQWGRKGGEKPGKSLEKQKLLGGDGLQMSRIKVGDLS